MKKSEKNRNLRLRYLLILLLICAIVFVSSTYAWFTSNKEVSIDPITVNVRTSAGIQISADGETWKSIITLADLKDAQTRYGFSNGIANNFPTTEGAIHYIEPVSTPMTITNGEFDMYYGTVKSDADGDFALSAKADQRADGHYIVFDIFLKTNSDIAAEDILIDLAGTEENPGSGVTIDQTQAHGIDNAARIAFINEGTATDSSNGATIRNLTGGDDTFLWEPNADTHTTSGVANARTFYMAKIGTADGISESGPSAGVPYDAVNTTIEDTAAIKLPETNVESTTYGSNFTAMTPDAVTAKSATSAIEFMPISKGITKLRVYMWIEGQDVDCENDASGTSVTFNLKFKLKEDTEAGA